MRTAPKEIACTIGFYAGMTIGYYLVVVSVIKLVNFTIKK